jgi:geranylgeranyl reductase family protein
MRFDAAIVGAGPAGCIAARELARAGARVALVDGSHPREKACGGGVTGRALTFVPEANRSLAQSIESAVFEAAGRRASVRLPGDDVLRVFPRASLDAALVDQAIRAGAIYHASRAKSVQRKHDGWKVDVDGRWIDAAWLLGADGPSGLVRKRVSGAFARRQLSIAAGSFVDAVSSSEVVIEFLADPPGYLWSFPRPDHLAVGACAQADRTTPDDLHRIVDEWLDRYAPAKGRPRRRYAWPIPSLAADDFDREDPAGDRWMLLGDAAGLVDPITREGIFFALQSGVLAARALGDQDSRRTYSSSVRSEIHAELRRAATLRDMFFRPRFARLLIDALNRSAAIRTVMIDLIGGPQHYKGLRRRLLATAEIGLMAKLLFARG